ncbi:MAG: glycine oxidase ThiO [Deltaproteobacteria bacterium]|nr:glycine oxidase ThiO [Deltaproteobacteria bacterium]
MKADVVVIGAGVQGCAVALRLSQAGKQVLVLERSIPGAEASSAAGGILSPGVEAEEPGPFYDLCAASLARYPAFAEELTRLTGVSVGFRGGGTLEVAFDDPTARVLAARAEQLQRHQVPVEVLDGEGALSLEPGLAPAVRGGLWFRGEASVDPRPLARALYLAAHAAGAEFLTGQVLRIRHEGGRAAGVDHDRGRIDAGAVVLAAGSWSGLVEGSGLPPGAVRPVRGQIALLDTRVPLLRRVIFSDKGYVVPRADGRLLCGSTMEEVGYERGVTAAGLRSVLDLALEIAPALARAPVVETWSNFRPASPDGSPVLGPAALPGLHYATGHTRNGILLCPITADSVSAAILGRPPPVDLAPFSVERLGAGRGQR